MPPITTGKIHRAIEALSNEAAHHRRYRTFMTAMVYGEKPKSEEAMKTA
jgi:hypothetical protein